MPQRHRRLRHRFAAVLIPACLLVGVGQVLVGWSGPSPAGATAAVGPLHVSIATYDGDTVTSSPSESALAGSDVTYLVTVTNAGSATQTALSVSISLPADFVLGGGTVRAAAGTVATAGGVLTWSIPLLAAGATTSVTYTETVDAPSTFESDSTTAVATSDQSQTATSVAVSVGVVPAADLTVAVTDGIDTVAPGASDTYTVTLTNNGPSAAANATVSGALSSDIGALTGESTLSDANFTDLGGGQSEWTGVNVASGASATFSVSATVPASISAGTVLLNVVTVSTAPDEVNTNPVDDATDSDIVANASPTAGALGLAISSFDGDGVHSNPSESAPAGTDVTYQVTATNTTASTQTEVSVPVTLPSRFTLDSTPIPSAGTVAASSGALVWSIPSLAGGASATLNYTETTDAPAAVEVDTTTVSASSAQSSPAAVASEALDVFPAADLSVAVSDGVNSIAPAASDTYTITLTNDGPSAAADVTVSDALNGGFSALFAVSSVRGTSFTNLGGDQFAWTGINLASGASATFNLMGSVASTLAAGSAFVNLASATLPPGEVVTGTTSTAVDSDAVIAAPQVISFTAPATGVAGQSVTLSASGGGSGNPVVFSVDPSSLPGVCAVSGTDGSTLEFEAAGTCMVDASQSGNASYAAAPTVGASIAVEQSPTFTADTPATTAAAGQVYSYGFAASATPTPTYALAAGAPSWLTLSATSGALAGTPPSGTTSFTYSVVATNAVGSATVGPFAVQVTQPGHSGQADISVILVCPATAAVGTDGDCTLALHNAGPASARSVTAELALSFRLHRISATGGARWFGNAGTWFVGSLPSGSSASYGVQFRAAAPGRATLFAAGLSTTSDPSIANNVAVAAVEVTGHASSYPGRTGTHFQRGGRPPVRGPGGPGH